MIRNSSLLVSFILGVAALLSPRAGAQIEGKIEVHGGLAKWKSFGTVEYDSTFENAKGSKADHQLFNLRNRDGLITADKYTLGASEGEVWIKPGLDALGGTPPRFYFWTPFYFFAMPFVFADPGATQESLGRRTVGGREHDAIKITYKAGTGDSPDDFYVAYFDSTSGQLRLATYVVTYPALRKGKPIEALEQHAIVFEEWQEVDGLTVPKVAQYYNWKDENLEGEALGKMSFLKVRFSKSTPDGAQFAKPADAVAAPL